MKTYSLKVSDGYWHINVAADRRDAVIDALRKHDAVLSVGAACLIGKTNSEAIKVEVTERIEILAICEGGGEKSHIIERLQTWQANTFWWKVSVDPKRRDSVMAAILKHRSVSTSTPWDEQAGRISVKFVSVSQHSEREEVADLIEQLVSEDVDSEPEPVRHSILDQHWVVGHHGRVLRHDNENRCLVNIGAHVGPLSHVPDLLRALEESERVASCANWNRVKAVLADMKLHGE